MKTDYPNYSILRNYYDFETIFQYLIIETRDWKDNRIIIDETNPHNILMETLRVLCEKLGEDFKYLNMETIEDNRFQLEKTFEKINTDLSYTKTFMKSFEEKANDLIHKFVKIDLKEDLLNEIKGLNDKNKILLESNESAEKDISILKTANGCFENKLNVLLNQFEKLELRQDEYDIKLNNLKEMPENDLKTLGLKRIKRKVKSI